MINAQSAKGIERYLVGEGVDPSRLRFHVSEVEAGGRSHAAHTHEGTEAFFILEGTCEVEIERERYTIGPNESIIVDARRPHGISNAGSTKARYLVIISS